jgi:hypothetical protein
MFIFSIEQDIWVTRSNMLLKSHSIARGYQIVLQNVHSDLIPSQLADNPYMGPPKSYRVAKGLLVQCSGKSTG